MKKIIYPKKCYDVKSSKTINASKASNYKVNDLVRMFGSESIITIMENDEILAEPASGESIPKELLNRDIEVIAIDIVVK